MKVTIHYTTSNTAKDMDEVDTALIRAAEMHGGTCEGSGMGPDGRELTFEGFMGSKDIQRFLKQINSVVVMLINRCPGLSIQRATWDRG